MLQQISCSVILWQELTVNFSMSQFLKKAISEGPSIFQKVERRWTSVRTDCPYQPLLCTPLSLDAYRWALAMSP